MYNPLRFSTLMLGSLPICLLCVHVKNYSPNPVLQGRQVFSWVALTTPTQEGG